MGLKGRAVLGGRGRGGGREEAESREAEGRREISLSSGSAWPSESQANKGYIVRLYAIQFYISLTQARVILEEGTSIKKMSLQNWPWASFAYL